MYLSAVYGVIRTRGNFGAVNVSWMVSPDFTQDVFPVQGTVCFGDQEFFKNITVYSLVDEVSAAYIVFCLACCKHQITPFWCYLLDLSFVVLVVKLYVMQAVYIYSLSILFH